MLTRTLRKDAIDFAIDRIDNDFARRWIVCDEKGYWWKRTASLIDSLADELDETETHEERVEIVGLLLAHEALQAVADHVA